MTNSSKLIKNFDNSNIYCSLKNLKKNPTLKELLENHLSDYKLPFKAYDRKIAWEGLFIEFISSLNYLCLQKKSREHISKKKVLCNLKSFVLYSEKNFSFLWRRQSKRNHRGEFHVEYKADFLPIYKFKKDPENLKLRQEYFAKAKLMLANPAALIFLFCKFFGDIVPLSVDVYEKGSESINALYHPNVFIVPVSYGLYKKYVLKTDMDIFLEIRKLSLKKSLTKTSSRTMLDNYNHSHMILEWYAKDSPFDNKAYLKFIEEYFYV